MKHLTAAFIVSLTRSISLTLAMMDMSPLQDHSQPPKHRTQGINFPTWEFKHRNKLPSCGEKLKLLELIKWCLQSIIVIWNSKLPMQKPQKPIWLVQQQSRFWVWTNMIPPWDELTYSGWCRANCVVWRSNRFHYRECIKTTFVVK